MKSKQKGLKRPIVSLVTALAFTFAAGGVSAGDKGSSGAANGQPFQYLQAQIDAVKTSLEKLSAEYNLTLADIESDVAYLQSQIDSLKTQLADLQDDTDANAGEIDALQNQIGELESELTGKQDILDSGCPSGSALRVIEPDGGYICESISDSNNTGALYTITHYSGYLRAYRNGKAVRGVVSCPEGTKVLSGGYVVAYPTYSRASINVLENVPYGSSGWALTVNNSESSRYVEMVRIVARCGI